MRRPLGEEAPYVPGIRGESRTLASSAAAYRSSRGVRVDRSSSGVMRGAGGCVGMVRCAAWCRVTYSAAAFDEVFVREDRDRRGRESGQTAALVRAGLLAGGLTEDRIAVVLDEVEALRRGIAALGVHDLLVVLSDTVPETFRLIDALEPDASRDLLPQRVRA